MEGPAGQEAERAMKARPVPLLEGSSRPCCCFLLILAFVLLSEVTSLFNFNVTSSLPGVFFSPFISCPCLLATHLLTVSFLFSAYLIYFSDVFWFDQLFWILFFLFVFVFIVREAGLWGSWGMKSKIKHILSISYGARPIHPLSPRTSPGDRK